MGNEPEMTGEDLSALRALAISALKSPGNESVPESERDLVIRAVDLIWLLDHVESPLHRAVRIARGHQGPPDEPVRFTAAQQSQASALNQGGEP